MHVWCDWIQEATAEERGREERKVDGCSSFLSRLLDMQCISFPLIWVDLFAGFHKNYWTDVHKMRGCGMVRSPEQTSLMFGADRDKGTDPRILFSYFARFDIFVNCREQCINLDEKKPACLRGWCPWVRKMWCRSKFKSRSSDLSMFYWNMRLQN